ncbi:hypothetical protein [Cyclobacterium marinum]|uniref:hypothetical protein n=1 Tax=Cyclobacterium marinum TaxID=104 RepID=UPI0011EBE538|nr:hypothetical protein [Cyclobacterium marinum]MBI0398674.1 hypothetical protein [Cyclobacterium marinum]
MGKYSLIHTENIPNPTKIDIWELCKYGKSLLQMFIDEHQNDALIFDKIAGALSIIEITSNLLRLPKTKFRLIEGHGMNCKVYEAKSGIIRLYLFHEENTGRVIVTGGKKGNQKEDIKSVLQTIKNFNNESK